MATQADLDALKKARASGVLRVEYADKGSMTYRSADDLRKAIDDVEAELAAAAGSTPITQSFAKFNRG